MGGPSASLPLLRPAGEARPDWWIIAQVAARLGWAADFAWDGPAAIFREHAALTGLGNGGRRAFDISGLAGMTDAEYKAMAPTRWPVPAAGATPARFFADGAFPAGRARFVGVSHAERPEGDGRLTLLTGGTTRQGPRRRRRSSPGSWPCCRWRVGNGRGWRIPPAGLHRGVLLREGRAEAALFLGPHHRLPPRDWPAGVLAGNGVAPLAALLAGRVADGPPPSPTLRVCHGVSQDAVRGAVRGGACSLAAVGEATRGHGLRPEIAALLAAGTVAA